MIEFLLWVCIFLFTHELGHYVIAKKDGIYNGWGLTPTPHIKLTKKHNSRWKYLSGMIGSLLSYPFFILIYPFPSIFYFTAIVLVAGIFDIIIMIVWRE